MDEPGDPVLTMRARWGRWASLAALAAGAAVSPLRAQELVHDASRCFAWVADGSSTVGAPRGTAGGAAGNADGTALAAARAALRGEARQAQAAGLLWGAVDRLEAARALGGPQTPPDGPLLAQLARSYAAAGCPWAAAVTANEALAAGAPAVDVGPLRAIQLSAASRSVDSLPVANVTLAPDDSVREGAIADYAWQRYRAGQFTEAVAAFDHLAAAAPGLHSRLEARAMAAQALLEAGNAVEAGARFRVVGDSARGALAALAALAAVAATAPPVSAPVPGSSGAPTAPSARQPANTVEGLALLLARERLTALAWAPDLRDGRLLAPSRDPEQPLQRVQAAEVVRRLDALGAPAVDVVSRALLWMPANDGLAALRSAADALAKGDARVARAGPRIAALTEERTARMADAGRLTSAVRPFADSIAVTQRELAALADSLARHDAAIAENVAQYRTALLGKIGAVRTLAAQNRARMDSLETSLQRAGAVAMRVGAAEQGTAQGYLATADAAASALEAGLTRLPVVFQRDTIRRKYETLRQSHAAARALYDSVYALTVLNEQRVTADADRRIGEARDELRAAESERRGSEEQAAVALAAVLRLRAAPLRASLERTAEASEYGAASSAFFAAVGADTNRSAPAPVMRLRDAAVQALADVVARRAASPLRARALVQLGELLARKADEEYAVAQRAGAATDHADYTAAAARYDELLRDFPADAELDAAAYTLGSLRFLSQQYDEAARAFERVLPLEGSRFRAESFFRHGDAKFELASKQSGEARKALLVVSAQSYTRAISLASADGDIHYLALYKLGWSEYAQADRQASAEYQRAVDAFARLVREMDELPAERQSRLALRQEAVDYLAIAITQIGGAEEAVRNLANIPDRITRLLVLRRVARALRDQGEFTSALIAYRAAVDQAPVHATLLDTRLDVADIYQSRLMEPGHAQEARLLLAESTAPTSPWGKANPARAADASRARERALRESGSYALSQAKLLQGRAQAGAAFAGAAELLASYLAEFSAADSAQRVSALEGEALFAAGDFARAATAFNRTALGWKGDAALEATARRNAIVASDSALLTETRRDVAGETPAKRAARLAPLQDSLFAATDRFAATATDADSRGAIIAKGRRAAEGGRWREVAESFEAFIARFGNDSFAPDARKFVGDARYRQGRYADAQREWLAAQQAAGRAGRRALTDSIVSVRLAAASQRADSLAKLGRWTEAADSVFGVIANDIGDPARAADAMRNAIEVHLAGDSVARAAGDATASAASRTGAIGAIERLAARFPAYQHTLTYAALRPKLLSDVGRPVDAVSALQALVQSQPTWPGRPDAMVRAAVLLDSLGHRADAAAAFEKFSVAYAADKRAADAQYNAAILWTDAKDPASAAKAYALFLSRFPRDQRAAEAQRARLAQLRAVGDSTVVSSELARLCAQKVEALAVACADRAGALAFRDGMAGWERYAALKLVIASRAQLNKAGVDAASAPKLTALRTMAAQFARAVASGAPEWVAAATFQSGLAQWYYGIFLRDVELPADITDAQRDGARRGSAQQAQAYFDAAVKMWQALIGKAASEAFDNPWVEKAKAALKGDGIPAREVTP